MRDLNREMELRHDLWFLLSPKQRRKLSYLGYSSVNLADVEMSEFRLVTKSRELIERLITIKRMTMRVVA